MLDVCDILRPAMVEDRYGLQQPTESALPVATTVKCRLIRARRWVYRSDVAKGAIVEGYKLIMPVPVNYTVLQDDLIEIDGRRFRVTGVVPRRGQHLTLDLVHHGQD